MTPEEMNAIIQQDFQHLGYGSRGSAQRALRAAYPDLLRHYLAIDSAKPRGDILREAIDLVRITHPDGTLDYEHEYFGIEP